MKNDTYLASKLKNTSLLAVTVILFSISTTTFATTSVQNTGNKEIKSSAQAANVQSLVADVLRNTESSLLSVESNTWDSLQHVENALQSIREIKNTLSPDTHVEAKSPLVIDENKEYWFKYPSVDKGTLYNKEIFPTLHSKYKSGVFYQGVIDTDQEREFSAYFDYAFAYASLRTARDALSVSKFKEANIALKWVFEAVYLRPNFYVSEQNYVDLNDKLINIKGDYPVMAQTQDK